MATGLRVLQKLKGIIGVRFIGLASTIGVVKLGKAARGLGIEIVLVTSMAFLPISSG